MILNYHITDSIAPTSVALDLMASTTAAAADSGAATTHLTAGATIVDASNVIVIDGMLYSFQAKTQDSVPDAEIVWTLADGTELQNDGAPTSDDGSCIATGETDDYMLTAAYDAMNGMEMTVTAGNPAGAAVDTKVTLTVKGMYANYETLLMIRWASC